MAQSSIHIEKGHAGFLTHNDRSRPTKNTIFHDEKNEIFNDSKEAFKIYRDELQKRSEAYTQKTKQKLQKNAITHLSAIVNLNANHTLEDLKPLISHLETELDTKVFQVAIHRDEGHIKTDTKEPIKNYHAHIEFMGLDSQGSSVRRKLTKKFLSDLQTKTAELLQMERGRKHSRAKRLDTYEFKNHKQREQKTLAPVLAKQKDLTALNNKLREQLKQADLDRETKKAKFRELEQLNRELKQQIKNKDLTIEELKEKLQAHSIGTSSNKLTLLQVTTEASKIINKEIKAHKETQKELIEARKTIFEQKVTIDTQEELIERLRANISYLKHKIKDLKQQLKKRSNMQQHQKVRKQLHTTNKELKSVKTDTSSPLLAERSEINIREVEQFMQNSTGTSHKTAKKYLRLTEELSEAKKECEAYKKHNMIKNLKEAQEYKQILKQELAEQKQKLLKAGFEPAQKNEVFEFKYESENTQENDEILNNTL